MGQDRETRRRWQGGLELLSVERAPNVLQVMPPHTRKVLDPECDVEAPVQGMPVHEQSGPSLGRDVA